MQPLPGNSVAAEFHSRFDADLAVAMLGDAGIEGIVLGDPAASVAPHHIVEHGFRVVVRDEVLEDATTLLAGEVTRNAESDALDDMYHRRHFAHRPTWVRYGTYAVLAAFAGPVTLAVLFQLRWGVENLFP